MSGKREVNDSDEDFDFQQGRSREQVDVEDVDEAQYEAERSGVMSTATAGPRLHGDSNFSATTATTTEDEDSRSGMSEPTPPSGSGRRRIVELSRAEPPEDEFTDESFNRDANNESDRKEDDEAWETLPGFRSHDDESPREGDDDFEEKDEPIIHSRLTASDVDSYARGSIGRYDKEDELMNEPYQRDKTTTCEGWIAVRFEQDQWQERYCIIQPAFGIFAFDDEIDAQAWRREDETTSYDVKRLLSCEGLRVAPDSDLSTESEEATHSEYRNAMSLSNEHSALVVIAVPDATRTEWIHALEGARPVADYVSCCEELGVMPIPSLLRSALMNPPMKSLVVKNHDLSDLDILECVCQLAMSCGRQLISLRLEHCGITDEGALLLKDCLSRLPSLQELDLLGNNDLGDVGTSALLMGISQSRLRVLSLSKCRLGDAAGIDLSQLIARSPALERVDLSGNKLSKASGVHLVGALIHCPQIQALFLGDNPELRDETVFALSGVFPALPGLRELDLSRTRISDAGLRRLERAFQDCPSLSTSFECLDLRDNPSLSRECVSGFLAQCQLLKGVILLSDSPRDVLVIRDNVAQDASEHETIEALVKTSSLIVSFAGNPTPSPDRMRETFLQMLADVQPSRMMVIASPNEKDPLAMRVTILDDEDGFCAQRLAACQHEPKLKLLRVASIEIEHDQKQAVKNENSGTSLVLVTKREEELAMMNEPVSLEVLSASVQRILLDDKESSGIETVIEHELSGLGRTLSPLLRSALTMAVQKTLPRSALSAAAGLLPECESEVARETDRTGEKDVDSLFQCAGVLGDAMKLRQYVLGLSNSKRAFGSDITRAEEESSFECRIAEIIVRSRPQKLAPEQPLSLLGRLRDTRSRPLTRSSRAADEQVHAQACEKLFDLIQIALGYEERSPIDVDGTGAVNELFGMCLRSSDLVAELHVDLALRTCLNDTSRPTNATWSLAVLALRCVPCALADDSRLALALAAAYKRSYAYSKEHMALQAMTALDIEPQHAVTHPLKRLEVIRKTLRREAVNLTVMLPDERAVVIECTPFSTMLETLIEIDRRLTGTPRALPTRRSSPSSTANLVERWRGFSFIERDVKESRLFSVVKMEEDPHWWTLIKNSSKKLVLAPIVSSGFIPSLAECDPTSPDELTRGDAIRNALLIGTEKDSVKRTSPALEGDVEPLAYLVTLAIVEEFGEDAFRSCGLGEFLKRCEARVDIRPGAANTDDIATTFRDYVMTVRSHLLGIPKGLIHKETCRAAYLHYARVWPLSQASTFRVRPKRASTSGIVIDDNNLPSVALLTIGVRSGIALLTVPRESLSPESVFDFRRCLWACDIKTLLRVETNWKGRDDEVRLVLSGQEDWLVVEFESNDMAKTFVTVLQQHLWAMLAHGGVIVPTIRWLEDFSFKFPQFPAPPPPPRLAVPPGGILKTKIPRDIQDARVASLVLLDSLVRPRCKKDELPPSAFYYSANEVSDVVLAKIPSAGALLDAVEASLALPPSGPPPPINTPSEAFGAIEYPLPIGPPPDDEPAMRPPMHPPPVSPSTKTARSSVSQQHLKTEVAEYPTDSAVESAPSRPPVEVEAPVMIAPPVNAMPPTETEEEAKIRMKKEFLRKKREREKQMEEQGETQPSSI